METENRNKKGKKQMKTAHKLLILASPVIFLPMFAIAMALGMNDGLVLFTLITYTITLIKTLSI